MKIKYEIYNCNNGNPTAIISNPLTREQGMEVADKIYEIKPEFDQAAMIQNIDKNNCTFRLIGGEFCGNACLTVGGFMHKNYGIEEGYIINNIDRENNTTSSIIIQSKCDGETCCLNIPKEALIQKVSVTKSGKYLVTMNGISHIIIPNSFGEQNKEIAENEKREYEENNKMPDVLGIIFLDENKIDPFIWIEKIKLFQNQTACLSGSVAAAEFLTKQRGENENIITQPTGESYQIKIGDRSIKVKGRVKCIDTGELTYNEKENINDIRFDDDGR